MDGDLQPPANDDCPHCSTGTLHTWLDAELKAVLGRRQPMLEHHTMCDTCDAKRVTTVRLDQLDTVSGGWTNVAGQQSLEDHD